MKTKTKKVMAIIMLILMLINAMPISAFATFITDINSDATFGVISGSLSEYGHELHYANYDGSTYIAFCTQFGKTSPTGRDYAFNNEFYAEYKENRPEYERIAEMIYFGYTMNYGLGIPSSTEAKKAACATQQYVWEYIYNNIDSSGKTPPSRNSWSGGYMSSSQYSNWVSNTENLYNQYHKDVSFNGATNKVDIGDTTTFSDSNGVLQHYESFNKTINGVNFAHDNGSNELRVTATNDSNSGKTTFKSRDYGYYELMPNGAKYSSGSMSNYVYFSFSSGAVQNLMFSNYVDPSHFSVSVEVQSGKVLVKKINNMGNPVADCNFELYKDEACTQKVASGKSASNGQITFEKLKVGTYFVKETSVPTGYLLDTNIKRVDVRNGETSTVEFKNNEPTGKLLIHKVSENNDKVGGAIFSVTAEENIKNVAGTKTFYTKGQEVAKITSANGTGIAEIAELPLGKYSVREIQAPKGYLLNEQVFQVNLEYKNSTTPVIELEIKGVVNHEPTGTIAIVKKDSKTGSVAQGDATLENAVYKIYANEDIYNVAKSKKFYSKGDLVATRNTDKNGNTTDVTGLPLGNYIVKEEVAPKGYLLDTTVYEVKLEYKDQYEKIIYGRANSKDKVKEMGVHIFKSGIKVNSGMTPGLAGAEFTIKLNSAVEKAYENGYSYEEVWNGIDEYGNSVTVDSNRVAEAQEIAPTYETIVTNESGDAYTQNKLPYGTYIVKETKTPKDYETATDFTFSITDDETEIQDVAKKVKHIVVNNEQQETYIKLVKKDLKTDKVVTLTNATFQIKATKDIYDRATKKILYKKGEAVSQKIGSTTYNSFTTNADNLVVPDKSYTNDKEDKGTIITPLKLEVGSYEVTEIKIPEGFLQLDNSVKFDVKGIRNYDKDPDGDFIKEIVIKNEQPTATIIIDKSVALREDVDTSIVDISDLSPIQFKLTAKEDVIDKADGSVIYKKGQEIRTFNLDKDGNLKIEELPIGVYELQEIKTLDGLVLNNEKYEFKFEKKDDTTKVYTETREVINDTTLTEISKQDITGEKELEGAKLTVLEGDKVIDTWTSTDKTHKIEGLKVDTEYTLREEIAPDGYVRATDIKFKVENTKENQKVTMIDKIVTMTKEDIGGKEIEGAKIQVTDKDGNIIDEWTSGKESHNIKGLEENKEYILHEEYAPDGYVIATDIEFKVTENKETQKVTMTDKVVEISKEDIGGKEIEGATLQVLDKDGNIIDEWTSGKEAHKVKGLKEGETYKLHEEVCVNEYVKATDVEFKVTENKETQKIVMIDKIVEIVKTDLVTGEEIEGAKLKVVDENNEVIDEWESTKEPHKVTGLEENKTYKLIEVTTPYGYEIAEEIAFTVTTDKETQKIEMKDMPILKDVKVVKIDSKTKEIIKAKFTFGLYEDEECTKLIQQMDSNKDEGIITFEDLRYGTYFIKEITAPKGYNKSDEVAKVEINDKGVFVNGNLIEEKDSAYSFEFENAPIETPNTNDGRNTLLLSGIAGMSALTLATIGIYGIIKRRKNK